MGFFEDKKKIALKIPGGRYKQMYFAFGSTKAYLENTPLRLLGGKKGTNNSIPPATVSVYIGSSAGSINATVYACGYTIQQIDDCFFHRYDKTPIRMPTKKDLLRKPETKWWNPIPYVVGLKTTAGIKTHVDQYILKDVKNFDDLDAELYIFAVEANRSRTVIFGKKESKQLNEYQYRNHATISEAIAASIALPGYYLNYPIYDPLSQKVRYYEDGDIRDFFETNVAQDSECDLVLIPCIYVPADEETFKECIEPGIRTLIRAYAHVLDHSLDTRLKKSMYTRAEKKVAVSNLRKDSIELLSPFEKMLDLFEESVKEQLSKKMQKSENKDEIRDIINQYFLPSIHESINDVRMRTPKLRDAIDELEERLIKNLNYFPQTIIPVLPAEGSSDAKKLNKITPFTVDPEEIRFCMNLGYKRTLEVLKGRKII